MFEKDQRGNISDANKLVITTLYCLQHRKLEKAQEHSVKV